MKLSAGNLLQQHPLISPLLLVVVVVAVYYPALWSGFHPVDDSGIVAFYASNPPLSQLLIPGNSYYYRPIIELSFYFDNLFWQMEPAVMHLENVLVHCINTLLVFSLARRFCKKYSGDTVFYPLCAALLFAVHPVNVEAVAWIAGRTDLLLAMLLLGASYFWLNWFQHSRLQDICAALTLTSAALLTKETAFAYIGVVPLLRLVVHRSFSRPQWLTILGTIAAFLLVALLMFGAYGPNVGAITRMVQSAALPSSISEMLTKTGAALGWYVSKLFIPLPLNFAVIEVPLWYGALAVALVPLLLLLLLYRFCRPSVVFCCAALLLLLPVLVLAVHPIAWTPVAERYLYLPSGLCSIGLAAAVAKSVKRFHTAASVGIIAIVSMFAVVSFQRSILWGDKEAFFRDAIDKSPGFGSLYNELGVLLLNSGRLQEAEQMLLTADRLNQRQSMRLLIKANLLGVQLSKGDTLGVRNKFFQLFENKQAAPADFLELLYRADGKRIHDLTGGERKLLVFDLLETLELLNRKRPDPFWLYRSGQLALDSGDAVRATDFFRRALNTAPADAHYRGAALTYLRRLESAP